MTSFRPIPFALALILLLLQTTCFVSAQDLPPGPDTDPNKVPDSAQGTTITTPHWRVDRTPTHVEDIPLEGWLTLEATFVGERPPDLTPIQALDVVHWEVTDTQSGEILTGSLQWRQWAAQPRLIWRAITPFAPAHTYRVTAHFDNTTLRQRWAGLDSDVIADVTMTFTFTTRDTFFEPTIPITRRNASLRTLLDSVETCCPNPTELSCLDDVCTPCWTEVTSQRQLRAEFEHIIPEALAPFVFYTLTPTPPNVSEQPDDEPLDSETRRVPLPENGRFLIDQRFTTIRERYCVTLAFWNMLTDLEAPTHRSEFCVDETTPPSPSVTLRGACEPPPQSLEHEGNTQDPAEPIIPLEDGDAACTATRWPRPAPWPSIPWGMAMVGALTCVMRQRR